MKNVAQNKQYYTYNVSHNQLYWKTQQATVSSSGKGSATYSKHIFKLAT